MWLNYRLFGIKNPAKLKWRDLYRQFGAHPSKASDWKTVNDFRTKCLRELKKIKEAWKGFDYGLVRGALVLLPSPAFSATNEPAGWPKGKQSIHSFARINGRSSPSHKRA